MSEYSGKLFDSRWFNKSDKIKKRDNNRCRICQSSIKLNCHHLYYKGDKDPWDYPDTALVTLCKNCHETYHIYDKLYVNGLDVLTKIISVADKYPFNILTLKNPILHYFEENGLSKRERSQSRLTTFEFLKVSGEKFYAELPALHICDEDEDEDEDEF